MCFFLGKKKKNEKKIDEVEKTGKEKIDKINNLRDEKINRIENETRRFKEKSATVSADELRRMSLLEDKIKALTAENNIEGLSKAIDDIVSIADEDVGKKIDEEMYFDSLKKAEKEP